MTAQKHKTQKNCYSASPKKVQYKKNAIGKNCSMKRVLDGKSVARTEGVQPGKSTASKVRNTKKVQHE